MSLRHKQTYCVESALPNRKLAVRVINHEPIVQKLPLGPFVLCHPDQNLLGGIQRFTPVHVGQTKFLINVWFLLQENTK